MQHMPDSFPTVAAEKAELDLLLELGLSDTQAGLLILTHHSYDPLHALLSLDQLLSRQGALESPNDQPVQNTRNWLRTRYLRASRQVVEKLFALNLAGQTAEARGAAHVCRENRLSERSQCPAAGDVAAGR